MTTYNASFGWISSAASDKGKVRKINEDAHLDLPERGLWAVADGMGGHEAGDLASQSVVAALESVAVPNHIGQAVADLRRRLAAVNQSLQQTAAERGGRIIGSTVVVLLNLGAYCACLWAGDSRIYLLRDGVLRQLTRDHSQVEELVAAGLLDRAAAEHHPAGNVITRAVGGAEQLELDAQIIECLDGDLFLLCSDGLTKELGTEEIAESLLSTEIGDAARDLVERALGRGARDNVTVVAAKVFPRHCDTPA